MSQRSVSAGGMAAGLPGQIADSNLVTDIVSGFSNEATVQLPLGYGVAQVAGIADAYQGASGASGGIAGINVLGLNHMRAGALDADGVNIGDMGASGLLPDASMQIGRKGRFYVPVEHNVRPDDRAFCRIVATGALTPGSWVGTNFGGSYVKDCTAQGVFRSTTYTSADGTTKVAVLEVDFTNKP